MKILGAMLKAEREKVNLSQEDVAKRLNINRVTYTGWESGKHNPNVEDIIRLAEFFKTSTDYLLGRYTKQ